MPFLWLQYTFKLSFNVATQSVFCESALPRGLLEMQNHRPLLKPTKSESAFEQDFQEILKFIIQV